MTARNFITQPGSQFLPKGTGAIERTVNDKLRDVVSVKDFGAVGNNITDDTNAIKAAIAANGGRVIHFPPGRYKVTETINITASGTYIIGTRASVIQHTPNIDTFLFKPTTAGTTLDFINIIGIIGISVSHSPVAATSTSGAGVRFLQCSRYKLFDVTVNNAPEGITVQGGQLGSLESFQVFAAQGLSPTTDTSLLYFRQAPVGAGFQPCYTVEVEDFRLSASLLRESCILIQNADGLGFSNAYVALAGSSLVKVKNERDNSYIGAVSFVNVYLDCVGAAKTPTAIDIPADGFAGSNVFDVVIGSGCFLGNGDDYGILCRKPQTRRLSFKGATVVNFGKWAVDCESSTFSTDLHIEGCSFNNVGDSTSGAIRAANGNSLNITGNVFGNSIENVCVNLSGSWNTGTITGNTNSSNIADLLNTATFSGPLALAGNSSVNSASASSWRGLKVGNTNVDNSTTLDWYLEDSFTPTLSFGGGSTGIVYSSNIANFTRIGNVIMYTIVIVLSDKGSSTGALRITGLPYTSRNGFNYPASTKISDVSNDLGGTSVISEVLANSTDIRVVKLNTSGSTEFYEDVTDADIKNSTTMSINGLYFL